MVAVLRGRQVQTGGAQFVEEFIWRLAQTQMACGDMQRQRETTKRFGQMSRLCVVGHISLFASGFGLPAQQLDGIVHQQRFHFDPLPMLTAKLAHAGRHQHRATG